MEKTSKKTLIQNANLAGSGKGWLLICGDRIEACALGEPEVGLSDDAQVIDAEGMLLMPGAIDCHVHMRDPGLTHKADMATETRAAVAGGVTSVIDMPNTVPQTTTLEAWQQKNEIAAQKCVANYAFFIGATASNLDELQKADYTKVPGVKLFMGSSTGGMLVDDNDALDSLFATIKAPIVVHAEDEGVIAASRDVVRAKYGDAPIPVAEHSNIRPAEACVKATERAISLANRHNARLHVAHLTTAQEARMVAEAGPNVSCEVSPHHLLWCADDYARCGSRIKMNPAVKSATDRDTLRKALADGTIDIVATDHAPHTLAEKEGDALKAMSGAPMVQFSLPAILTLFDPATAVRTMCEGPAQLFGIEDRGSLTPGNYADLVLLKNERWTPTDADVVSRCGWTPLNGLVTLDWRVVRTWVNGVSVYPEAPSVSPAQPLTFKK